MDQREYLLQIQREGRQKYINSNREFYANPSVARFEPFEIADNLYYVGDRKVCVHLIDTGDGLILIDSGFLGTAHLLVDSIWRLGFDPRNIRWIIHTHGHSDHFGASDEFRRMYGAKLAISRADAQAIKNRPLCAHVDNVSFPYARIPEFDYEIEDGEVFSHGNVKIYCMLTPGHSDGVLSLFFDVTYQGNKYRAGLFGGAGVGMASLPYICYNGAASNTPEIFLDSVERLCEEKVDIHLGNHPGNNATIRKREKQLEEGGNPFIDSASWNTFLDSVKEGLEKTIASNIELQKEMNEKFGMN